MLGEMRLIFFSRNQYQIAWSGNLTYVMFKKLICSEKIGNIRIFFKQEYNAVGCVLPTHYCTWGLPYRDPPGQRTPWTETPPLARDAPGQRPLDREPPGQRPLPGQRSPPGQRPPLVMWPVVHAGTETLPVNRITDRCKNITLPQLHCGQ